MQGRHLGMTFEWNLFAKNVLYTMSQCHATGWMANNLVTPECKFIIISLIWTLISVPGNYYQVSSSHDFDPTGVLEAPPSTTGISSIIVPLFAGNGQRREVEIKTD